MTENKKNVEINNGWILCPSKSFPGKFYYFNVVNGEAAWSLNQPDDKGSSKEKNVDQVADKYHRYPEPTALPQNIFSGTKKPDYPPNISHNHKIPKFGQVAFPNYSLTTDIVCNSLASLKLGSETEKPMIDQKLSESDRTMSQYSKQTNIPISKRFTNYQKPNFSLFRQNKVLKPTSNFETPTPKNLFLECASEPQNFFPKPLIKKPNLNVKPKSPIKFPDPINHKSNVKTIITYNNKVESTNSSSEALSVEELENLHSSDLRLVLLAKRRSTDVTDTAVERKKPKPADSKPVTLKKKVTFNLKDETDKGESANDKKREDFIPLTSNLTRTVIETPRSPIVLTDKTPPLFIKLSPKTPSPNIEDQAPSAKYQRPTFQATAKYQWPNCQDTTISQPPTYQATANYQPPTHQSTANCQLPTRKATTNYKSPTHQVTANCQPPTRQVTANCQTPTRQVTANNQPPANYQQPTYQPSGNQWQTLKNTTWYIVADTDVLLLDYELIDQVVLSDPRCRLIIPRAVAADIEELCLGDCQGQQRVINARKLTRKLASPPPHFIVEPRANESDSIPAIMTTDSILECCMVVSKKYYVVLITNDPHLQIRANLLNIQCYKLNEIKYGVDIRPHKTDIKSITPNDDVTDSNQCNQSLFGNLVIKPDLDEYINSRNNDRDGKNQYENSPASPIKKRPFLSDNSSLDCGEFIASQQKSLHNTENKKTHFDRLFDRSCEVSSLNLTDKKNLKARNAGRNPFLPRNDKENGSVDFGKRILNPNIVSNNTLNIRKTIPNKKSNPENNDFQKDHLEYNFESNSRFSPSPISNMKLFESTSRNTCLALQQEHSGMTRDSKIPNPPQTKIKKMVRTITNNNFIPKNQLENQIPRTKDSTGLFKIPQQLPVKSATRYTSVRVESTTANDQIGTRSTIDSIEENLTKFRIIDRNMKHKIKTRIDEWVCCFMQIMEDALMNILQNNSVCMENTVAPLTLKDTLNCIKMLSSGHTKIRDFTNKLSESLKKCNLCAQGKSKVSVTPEDFMKIFGYGVLLIRELKTIHPQIQELNEAELRLKNLQITLENNTKEFDPELVKSPSIGKSDVDQSLGEIRPPFIKTKSYVIDYLKKHYNEWKTYTEDVGDQNTKVQKHTDFKVVRTIGKNLNLLKIDNNKAITLCYNNFEEDLDNRSKDKSRLVRLVENNQIYKPEISENEEINTKNETKISGRSNNESKQIDLDFLLNDNANTNVPLKKLVENLDKRQTGEFNNESIIVEDKGKDGGFKNIIDNNKEPLDLDLFFSEMYDTDVGGNVENAVNSEKHRTAQEINGTYNFGDSKTDRLNNTMCFLEDFYITPTISPESNNNIYDVKDVKTISNNIKETKSFENVTSHYFSSILEKNEQDEAKTAKSCCEVKSEFFTENQESHNRNENSEIHTNNCKTRNDDSGTHLDNYESSLAKTAQVARDDNTNDSGFENDSTCAHSVIKIFLHELSTTFKLIHTYVIDFIDEIRGTGLSGKRKHAHHNQASKALNDMVAIIEHLRSIIKRESAKNTVLKTLLRNAATTDKRITRYKQIVMKCLEQAIILESALKIIVSTTMDDFEALSTNAEILNSNLRYFNIFELD